MIDMAGCRSYCTTIIYEMRLLPFTIMSLLVASMTACGSSSVPGSNARSLACDVAVAFAETVIVGAKDRPIVFATDNGSFDSPLNGAKWWSGPRQISLTPPPTIAEPG